MSHDDPAALDDDLLQRWEQHFARWWGEVLEDPGAMRRVSEQIAARSALRSTWEAEIDRSMESMHLPSRTDLLRLARIVSSLEDRLVAVEDQVFEQSVQRSRLERETLKARVHAAEALVTVTERLACLEEKIDALRERLDEAGGRGR